jgi:hypothetical protein
MASGRLSQRTAFPADGLLYYRVISHRRRTHRCGTGAFNAITPGNGDQHAVDLFPVAVKMVKSGIKPIDLYSPDHGGNANTKPKDVYKGV